MESDTAGGLADASAEFERAGFRCVPMCAERARTSLVIARIEPGLVQRMPLRLKATSGALHTTLLR